VKKTLKIIAKLLARYYRTSYLCNIKNAIIMNKEVKITKGQRVENPDAELQGQGIVAFQMVNFTILFYGTEIETSHDTKIMEDGSQIVIGGCGFIPDGYKLTA